MTVTKLVAHMYDRVEAFNSEVLGLPVPAQPTLLQGPRKDWAVTALTEEVTEFKYATTVVDQADALMDNIFFSLGRLMEMGVPARAIFDEVDRANMQKARGELSKRPGSQGFDAIKPEGWTAPNHDWLLSVTHDEIQDILQNDEVLLPGPALMALLTPSTRSSKPRIALIGHARHGKDTVAEILRDKYQLGFTSSSLVAAEKIMLPAFKATGKAFYCDAQECFDDRVNHRAFWFDTISAFCSTGVELAEIIFEKNDVYVGIRNKREFNACKNAGLFDVVLWVDALDRLPPEDATSMTLEPWMADFIIDNNGSLEDLQRNVASLMCSLI